MDLARVSGIDAAGIGELVRVYNITLASGAVVRVVNANPRIREMLARVRLYDWLTAGPGDAPDVDRAADRGVAGPYDIGSATSTFRLPPSC